MLPASVDQFLSAQNEFLQLSSQKNSLFKILSEVIAGELQDSDFRDSFDFLFKNAVYFKKINDIRTISSDFCKEKFKKKIRIQFLNILGSVGLYSFLAQKSWPAKHQHRLNARFRLQQTHLVDQMYQNERETLFRHIQYLQFRKIDYSVTPFLDKTLFREFQSIFKTGKMDRLLYNRENQLYLDGLRYALGRPHESDAVRIRRKLISRCNKKLKLFGEFMKHHFPNPISKFEIVLLLRDFCFYSCYTPQILISVKRLSLKALKARGTQSGDFQIELIDRKKAKIAQWSHISQSEQYTDLAESVEKFLNENNEPGGLAFFAQVFGHCLFLKGGAQLRLIGTKIMFGTTLHTERFSRLLRVLDSFSAESLVLKRLCLHVLSHRKLTVDDLLIKNGIEHLVISFLLNQFELVALELSVRQLLHFLENLLTLLKRFYEGSFLYELLLKQYRPETPDLGDWIQQSKLRDSLSQKPVFGDLKKDFELWICVLKLVLRLGRPAPL